MATDRTTPEEERLSQAIAVLEEQLRGLAQDLAAMRRDIGAGELGGLSDAKNRTDDIRQWLGIALEMEMRLEKRGRDGRGNGTRDINLDDARHQIGCRLDRLRRARCPGRVPE